MDNSIIQEVSTVILALATCILAVATIFLTMHTHNLAEHTKALSDLTKQLVNIEQARHNRENREKRIGELKALIEQGRKLRGINSHNFVTDWGKTNKPNQSDSDSIQYLALRIQNITQNGDTQQPLKDLKAILDAFESTPNSRPNFQEFATKLTLVQNRLGWSINDWEEELKKLINTQT